MKKIRTTVTTKSGSTKVTLWRWPSLGAVLPARAHPSSLADKEEDFEYFSEYEAPREAWTKEDKIIRVVGEVGYGKLLYLDSQGYAKAMPVGQVSSRPHAVGEVVFCNWPTLVIKHGGRIHNITVTGHESFDTVRGVANIRGIPVKEEDLFCQI